jgi:hypothetical protein
MQLVQDSNFSEELLSKRSLEDKLGYLQESITKTEWKYYHLQGLENFIYHLDNLESDRTKARVAKGIFEYLCLVEEKIKQSQNFLLSDRREYRKNLNTIRRELTPQHWALSHFYSHELGFVIHPYYPLLVISMILLFFILKIFYSVAFSLVVVLGYSLGRVIYTQVKIKAKKVY